jgi:hypothetical protein
MQNTRNTHSKDFRRAGEQQRVVTGKIKKCYVVINFSAKIVLDKRYMEADNLKI